MCSRPAAGKFGVALCRFCTTAVRVFLEPVYRQADARLAPRRRPRWGHAIGRGRSGGHKGSTGRAEVSPGRLSPWRFECPRFETRWTYNVDSISRTTRRTRAGSLCIAFRRVVRGRPSGILDRRRGVKCAGAVAPAAGRTASLPSRSQLLRCSQIGLRQSDPLLRA